MEMGGAMLNGLSAVLELILNMVQLLVIASIVVNLLGADQRNQIVRIIVGATEPLYRPFRGIARKIPGPIDWAPMFVIMIIVFLQRGLLPYLRLLALRDISGP